MTLAAFRTRFIQLKAQGFIPSSRKGTTGVGHTLERALGITENNIALPDLGNIELKAHRTNVQSLITLFTFNNKVWQILPLEAIRKYGSFDKNGRKGLYYTMKLSPNSAGLFLEVQDAHISIRHITGEVIAKWQLSDLALRFQQKMPALILVSAFVEERNGREFFHFYRSQLMRGISPELLANQFKEENILVDLRLHDAGTHARNHGTGFRAYENKLTFLFQRIEEI